MLNRVIIVGNLGADPDIRYAQSGTAIANIRIAVNEKRKDQNGETIENVHWFRVTAFGKTAEVIANYTSKGSRIGIDGKLTQRTWEDQSGNKRESIEIRAEAIELLSPSQQNGQSAGNGSHQRSSNPPPPPNGRGTPPPPPPASHQYDDDIPF